MFNYVSESKQNNTNRTQQPRKSRKLKLYVTMDRRIVPRLRDDVIFLDQRNVVGLKRHFCFDL